MALLGVVLVMVSAACATDADESRGADLDGEGDGGQVGTGGATPRRPSGYECLSTGYSCVDGVVHQGILGFVPSTQGSGPCLRPVYECRHGCRLDPEHRVSVDVPEVLCREYGPDSGTLTEGGDADAPDADVALPSEDAGPSCTETCDGYCFTWRGIHGESYPNPSAECRLLPERCNGTASCECACEGIEYGNCGGGTTGCSCEVENGVFHARCWGA